MKKFLLTSCWIIIMIGVVFIASRQFKPKPAEEAKAPDPFEEEIVIEDPEPSTEVSVIDNSAGDKTFTEYIKAGDQYMKEFFFRAAIKEYLAAAKLNPRSTEALYKLGNAYLANNEPEKAKSTFEAAKSIDPESININLGIVRAYLALRDHASAKSILGQLDPNNYDVKFFLAIVAILDDNLDESRDIFQDIWDNAPEDKAVAKGNASNFLDKFNIFKIYKEAETIQLKTLLAKGMTEAGLYESAIPVLFSVINEKNNYRDAWIVLGYAYLNTYKNKDAIDAFKQAKALDPTNATISFFLGLSYYADNQFDKAILFIEKADDLGYKPKSDIDLKLGELYLIKEEYAASANRYEQYLAENPYDLSLYIRTIYLNIDVLDKPGTALILAQKAVQYHPNAAMSHNLLGWAQIANNDFTNAKNNLEKAMNIDPNLESTYFNLGLLYEEKGIKNLAMEYYKKAYNIGEGSVMANKAAIKFNQLADNQESQFYQVNTLNSF
ncbi:tetratricopeptide repeat protein [Patescibacteria group bacterium]